MQSPLPSPAFSTFSTLSTGSNARTISGGASRSRVGQRLRRLGEKLHFCRKTPATLDEVYDCARASIKAHERAHRANQLTIEALQSWSETLPTIELRELVLGICAAISPLADQSGEEASAHLSALKTAITTKLGGLRADEQSRNELIRDMDRALRALYTAQGQAQPQESLEQLDGNYQMLCLQAEHASARYQTVAASTIEVVAHYLLMYTEQQARALASGVDAGIKAAKKFSDRPVSHLSQQDEQPQLHTPSLNNDLPPNLAPGLVDTINRGRRTGLGSPDSLHTTAGLNKEFGFAGWGAEIPS